MKCTGWCWENHRHSDQIARAGPTGTQLPIFVAEPAPHHLRMANQLRENNVTVDHTHNLFYLFSFFRNLVSYPLPKFPRILSQVNKTNITLETVASNARGMSMGVGVNLIPLAHFGIPVQKEMSELHRTESPTGVSIK